MMYLYVAVVRSKFPDDVDALAIKYEFLSTEKAYCLYRLNQDNEGLKLLDGKDLETQNSAQLHLAVHLARPILWIGKTVINDGFEVAFNTSFVVIDSGDWETADQLLQTAES
ncbi:hypothetical protein PsorP6_014889 [Peronosclerospora sorghi]|uniref:Uncharacterized protein n=1 Tax=Peronosclerospora sorghi TaxID=230839 RepID=A0ACC0VRV6_9STRA|nr:hypothetical protein PsorP6_014889 [Peronosclerospora sorghi]